MSSDNNGNSCEPDSMPESVAVASHEATQNNEVSIVISII